MNLSGFMKAQEGFHIDGMESTLGLHVYHTIGNACFDVPFVVRHIRERQLNAC